MRSTGDGSRGNPRRFSAAELEIRLKDLILRSRALYPFSIMTSVQCMKKVCKRGDDRNSPSTHITVTVT